MTPADFKLGTRQLFGFLLPGVVWIAGLILFLAPARLPDILGDMNGLPTASWLVVLAAALVVGMIMQRTSVLTRAGTLAELPKLDRGGFHAFRRLWASERRHLSAHDVAAAGGWRSIRVMQDSYMQATHARCSRSLRT